MEIESESESDIQIDGIDAAWSQVNFLSLGILT